MLCVNQKRTNLSTDTDTPGDVEGISGRRNVVAQGIDRRTVGNGIRERLAELAKQVVKLLASNPDCTSINNARLTRPQHLGSSAIHQTKLLVRPDRGNRLGIGHADTSASADRLPVRGPLDVKCSEDLIDRGSETRHLIEGVTGGDSESETFLAAGDGRVVYRLDVDVVVAEKHVGRFLGESGIADEDGDNVRRAGNNGDVH